MNLLASEHLLAAWSIHQIEVNLLILFNIISALLLGMVVGYERSFHGRAAGIRTYGLVSMASAAVTVIVGYPQFWFAGITPLISTADPTRVIQGVVTGIGFLGAGVIMKEGLSISGLTTAASIWASSAIGVLCGAGFYLAAILLTLTLSASMIIGGWVEGMLPSRHAVTVVLHFLEQLSPQEQQLSEWLQSIGYHIAEGSTVISRDHGQQHW